MGVYKSTSCMSRTGDLSVHHMVSINHFIVVASLLGQGKRDANQLVTVLFGVWWLCGCCWWRSSHKLAIVLHCCDWSIIEAEAASWLEPFAGWKRVHEQFSSIEFRLVIQVVCCLSLLALIQLRGFIAISSTPLSALSSSGRMTPVDPHFAATSLTRWTFYHHNYKRVEFCVPSFITCVLFLAVPPTYSQQQWFQRTFN